MAGTGAGGHASPTGSHGRRLAPVPGSPGWPRHARADGSATIGGAAIGGAAAGATHAAGVRESGRSAARGGPLGASRSDWGEAGCRLTGDERCRSPSLDEPAQASWTEGMADGEHHDSQPRRRRQDSAAMIVTLDPTWIPGPMRDSLADHSTTRRNAAVYCRSGAGGDALGDVPPGGAPRKTRRSSRREWP